MKTLEKAGPQLTSRLKGDWIGLYRWSPNLSHCSHSKDQGSATKAIKIAEDDRKEKVNQRAATGSATKEPGSAAKEPCLLPSAYSFGTLVDEAFKQQLERWCWKWFSLSKGISSSLPTSMVGSAPGGGRWSTNWRLFISRPCVRRCRILLSGWCHAVLVAVWRSHWSVCLQDLQQRVQKHSEVETVDLVLKLKDKLVSMNPWDGLLYLFTSYFTSSCGCVCVSWVTFGLFGGHKL